MDFLELVNFYFWIAPQKSGRGGWKFLKTDLPMAEGPLFTPPYSVFIKGGRINKNSYECIRKRVKLPISFVIVY
jgi:hypothetical protein